MTSLQDLTPLQAQLNAILTAPIPFFFVVLAAIAVLWRVFEWRYREIIEKTKTLFELAKSEIELKSKVSDRIQEELKEEVRSFKEELDESQNRSPELNSLIKKVSSIESKMGELAQANNAVSDAVSRSTPWLNQAGLVGVRSGFAAGNFGPTR